MKQYSFHTCCPIMLREVLLHGKTFTPAICACDFPELKERLRGQKRCPSNKPCFLRAEYVDEVMEAQERA